MDEIDRQLRRYADAAEAQVPATPEAPTHRHSWRPWLAAAAVVALLGGSLTVFLAGRGTGDRLDTIPAEPSSTYVPLQPCPSPDPEPRPDQLQMALPFVARVQRIEDPGPGPDDHHLLIRPGEDDSIEVKVYATPPVLTDRLGPGARTVTAYVCDPFADDGPSPTSVTATLSPTPAGNRNLTVVMERWVIVLTAKPERTSSVTADDLLAVVAGMSWPAAHSDDPTDATAEGERCEDEPEVAIGLGSFTLTGVPDGFEPRFPVETTDTGPVDLGGESTARLSLVRPDGASIQVTAFAVESPRAFITASLGGGTIDHVEVRRCTWAGDGWERADDIAIVGTNGGRTMLAAQEWEYEGYLVIGSPEVDRATLVEVAGALRFGVRP